MYCGAGADDLPLCVDCERKLPWNDCACPNCALPQAQPVPCAQCHATPPMFDRAWAALRYAAPVQRGIHGLKYRAEFLHAHVLGRLMARQLLRRAAPMPQLIIPVPLHTTRLIVRGYNQALELARVMAAETGIRCAPDAARRIRRTQNQIGKTAAQRRGNVQQSFRVTRPLQGLHVALLDDVMTTGATLGELARVCREAGAVRIEAWAAARVGSPMNPI